MDNISVKKLSESVILIEWKSEISETTLNDITCFQRWLENQSIDGIVEIWPTYSSIAIHFIQEFLSYEKLLLLIEKYQPNSESEEISNIWAIPVCYEESLAPDMKELCNRLNLNKNELIKRHSETFYRLHFIGFLPGFMYLGGLDKSLHIARKKEPSLELPKGAVAIGGGQTGIYPVSSPGGWYVIGQSPFQLFNPKNEQPCFVKPGDKIRFKPITLTEFKQLRKISIDAFNPKMMLENG